MEVVFMWGEEKFYHADNVSMIPRVGEEVFIARSHFNVKNIVWHFDVIKDDMAWVEVYIDR